MISINEVRSTFLNAYAKLGHTIVDSSPLLPLNDPTLLFTNAGMVQFKNVFTGLEKRPYTRATTAQKCVRAGGKHNDLDNVGYTARHHTFFEMLGNFSFGDYFKDLAIESAWNIVTKDFGLDAKRLLVTIYHNDDEAHDLWKKIAGLSEDRIIRIPTSDNFWRMGDTGPCGPCSEIFFDHGDKIAGGPPGSADQDGDRFIEIWNLVFMQFEQRGPNDMVPLPKPSIDTGMGIERISAILQGQHDNYDTDLLRALIVASANISGVDPDAPAHKASHRVVADHLRSTSFLIADGVMPTNEGRGYVLRRIMRRAMRHLHMLGCKEPVMHKLVPALVQQMGGHYKELGQAQKLIEETILLEETRFKKTLSRGLSLLEDETAKLSADAALPGAVAFKLYDTFGFPLDLTQDVLRNRGIQVDTAGFDAAMDEQRRKARESWVGSGDAATDKIWFDLREKLGATEFFGYSKETMDAKITAIVQNGKPVDKAAKGASIFLLANQTPFYGESGGQVGDIGTLEAPGLLVKITDTQKVLGDVHVHKAEIVEGSLAVGDVVTFKVDHQNRLDIRANHSCTHLLHAALHNRFDETVTQKGSSVSADRLRFDINFSRGLTADDIAAIESEVNAKIRENLDVTTRLLSQEEAIKMGAMALFGEKYGDEVRVIVMGGADQPYSIELCGGTHVSRTGDIGFFKLVSEGALAAGIRRIEAVTGRGALALASEQDKIIRDISGLFSTNPGEIMGRLTTLMEEKRKMEREIQDLRKQIALGGGSGGGAKAEAKDVNGVKFLAQAYDGIPAKDLRGLADAFKKKIGSGVVALTSVNEGKAALLVSVTNDLTARFNAVELVKIGVAVLGGAGGGGRPDMAQAGGPDGAKTKEALTAIEAALK